MIETICMERKWGYFSTNHWDTEHAQWFGNLVWFILDEKEEIKYESTWRPLSKLWMILLGFGLTINSLPFPFVILPWCIKCNMERYGHGGSGKHSRHGITASISHMVEHFPTYWDITDKIGVNSSPKTIILHTCRNHIIY